jgi:hypothetical protein
MREYPSGYRDDIAGCIRNGSIQLTKDPAAVSSTPTLFQAAGAFPPIPLEGIASRLRGYRTRDPMTNPYLNGVTYSSSLGDRFLERSPSALYFIPMNDVANLRSRVRIGSAHRYVY